MINKIIFTFTFVAVGLLHAYVLSVAKINQNAIALEPQKKVSSVINLQRVAIKTPEPVVEPVKEEVLPQPPEPVIEEVVVIPPKIVEKKMIKKVVKKKVTKKKKVVKKKKKPEKIAKRSSKAQLSSPKRKRIKNSYLSKVKRTIEQRKRYPKAAKRLKQEGSVTVRFTILGNGRIKNITLLAGSKYKKLNRAAIKTIERIVSFGPIPKELNEKSMVVTLPIKYEILS